MIKKLLERNIVKEAVWYTSANAVVQICSLLGVLFVSRYLGPTNLGIYSFVQNFIAAFLTVLTSMDIYANWHIVQSKDRIKELTKYTYQKAVLSVPLIIILLSTSFIFLPKDIFHLTLVLCLPIITSIFSSYIFSAQEQKKAILVSLGMVLSSIVLLVLKIIAVQNNANLSVFVIINSIDGIVLTTICVAHYIKDYKKIDFKYLLKIEDFKSLIKNSALPFVYLLFWFLVIRADQFIVPLYYNAYTLGVYSSAVKVIEMTNVIIIILQALIVPRITHINNPNTGIKNMHRTIVAYVLVGLATSLVIYVLAPIIVPILFGEKFVDSVAILKFYAWSVPGLFVSYLFSVVFMSKKNYKWLALHAMFFGVLNVFLLYALTLHIGINGVATLSVFMYSLSALAYYALWRLKN